MADAAVCTCLAPYVGDGKQCSFDSTCADSHCDANARCFTKCTCPPNVSACKNDGTPGSATQCIPGTYCQTTTGVCNLG